MADGAQDDDPNEELPEVVMSLEFDEQRAIYDEMRDCVVFMGFDGPRMVRCVVTREALFAAARRRAQSAREMLDAFRSHAPRFQRIAARKFTRGGWAYDGAVMVLRRDIEAEDRDPV